MRIKKVKIKGHVTDGTAVIEFIVNRLREMTDVQKTIEEIESVAYNYDVQVLVLDFKRLRFMTSAFLSRLVALNKGLKQAGIELRVCEMQPEVERAFRICKLQKVIPIFPDREKATAS